MVFPPLAHEREVEVKIALGNGALQVPGDRDELIRVFENLIENALKYGAPGPPRRHYVV